MKMQGSSRIAGLCFTCLISAAGAISVGGCESYSDRMLNAPGPRATEFDHPDLTADMVNAQRLQALPPLVQNSFSQDHPGAAVTSVQARPSGTGPMLYRIGFIDDGAAGQATYRADGSEFGGGGDSGIVATPEPSLAPIIPPGQSPPATRELH